MDTSSDKACKICNKLFKIREHGLCCDLCDMWYHQRCLRMPAAMYKQLSAETLGDWFCPGCVQTKQHRASTSDLSGDSDDESNTTLGSEVTDTPKSFNPTNFTMTPARLVVTPAPSSSLDAANSSFQSVVRLDRDRRSWDTSLLRPQSHQAYVPLADWQSSLEPLDSVDSNSPPHQQSISFGEFPPQQSTDDAVNCSMQLRGSPQSSGVVEGIISDDDGNDETESYWDSVQETYLPIRDQPDPVAESQVSHQTLVAQPVHPPPHAVPTASQ